MSEIREGWLASRLMMTLAAAALAAVAGVARAQQPTSGDDQQALVVYCHDAARGTVSRMLARDCDGMAVSEAQARAIRNQRALAIQRALKGQENPDFAAKRMVSVGTGFFVAEGGKVVTNKHVVAGCDALSVETTAGASASATLLRLDDRLDLALIQANTTTPAIAVFQSQSTVQPGGSVTLIGYPDQGLPPRRPLMSVGSMLPINNRLKGERMAIRAEVRGGNSGGPVLDQWGNVVGIVNAKINTVKVYQDTKQFIRNVGFAITTPAILRFLDETSTSYRLNAVGSPLSPDQIFEKARPFVVRIGCWRQGHG